MRLNRRNFLQQGMAWGAALSLTHTNGLFALEELGTGGSGLPDLVAVRGGERKTMVDQALDALGGMKRFVKKGQSVLIKPNIGWDVPPERGANTHPDVVRRLVELCQEAGAGEISIFDHTCDNWQRAYDTSGISLVAKETGARLINGKDETLYRKVEIPGAKMLKTVEAHSLYLDSDVFINAPVLKNHSGAQMTACLKNSMGLITDRGFWHSNNLHQCIGEFYLLRKPTLNVLDAYHPMVRNGPRGKNEGDLVTMKCLIASPDAVTADAAATKLLGLKEPSEIRHIPIAANLGIGSMDLDKLNIRRIQL